MKECAERLQHFMQLRTTKAQTINAMMAMEVVSYDQENKRVVLSFKVQPWQLNPNQRMHGGMISTAIDITMGCVAYVFSTAVFTPTIQMSVNFDADARENDLLLIEGICDHCGSRLIQTRAIVRSVTNQKVIASANGSYAVNNESQKYRRQKTL